MTTDDAITQYEVDARGNLTKLTTPDGIALTMVYDARDWLTTLRDASSNEVRYTLDSTVVRSCALTTSFQKFFRHTSSIRSDGIRFPAPHSGVSAFSGGIHVPSSKLEAVYCVLVVATAVIVGIVKCAQCGPILRD